MIRRIFDVLIPAVSSSYADREQKTRVGSIEHGAGIGTVRGREHRYSSMATAETSQKPEGNEQPLRERFTRSKRLSFWDYMDRKLVKLAAQSKSGALGPDFSIEQAALKRLKQILHSVCDSTTVFPSILPDGENGVSAVWHADIYALEIFVESDLTASAVIKSNGSIYSLELDGNDKTPLRSVRGHLGTVSAHVKTHNPRWRELIAE